MAASWKEDWKEDLAKMLVSMLLGGLCVVGAISLWSNAGNFLIAVKPGIDLEYLVENGGAKEGMHVTGQVPYVYDSFAVLSEYDDDVSEYYYALPTVDSVLILGVPEKQYGAMETLWEETCQYVADGIPPASPVPLEGYVEKAQGRLPYLLSEYLRDVMGYSQEEVDAMGEPLVVVFAAEKLQRARIYAPVGMILLTSGILLAILYLFLRKRCLEKRQQNKKF